MRHLLEAALEVSRKGETVALATIVRAAASTAFGKTVVATYLIAQRKVNTLVVVHRRQLLDQWTEALSQFLGLAPKEIGQIGGGKRKPTEKIDSEWDGVERRMHGTRLDAWICVLCLKPTCVGERRVELFAAGHAKSKT